MKTKLVGIALLLLFVGMAFTGCVTSTNVRFSTEEPGASLIIDGEDFGVTPVQVIMGNGIWEEPDVVLKKAGFRDLHTSVKKEVKPVNLVFGLFLGWWPSLLWVYGPKPNQYYNLRPVEQ